jgi:hypothetical protein
VTCGNHGVHFYGGTAISSNLRLDNTTLEIGPGGSASYAFYGIWLSTSHSVIGSSHEYVNSNFYSTRAGVVLLNYVSSSFQNGMIRLWNMSVSCATCGSGAQAWNIDAATAPVRSSIIVDGQTQLLGPSTLSLGVGTVANFTVSGQSTGMTNTLALIDTSNAAKARVMLSIDDSNIGSWSVSGAFIDTLRLVRTTLAPFSLSSVLLNSTTQLLLDSSSFTSTGAVTVFNLQSSVITNLPITF